MSFVPSWAKGIDIAQGERVRNDGQAVIFILRIENLGASMKSERLLRIVQFCNAAEVIADIGCDHGLVSAELVRREIAGKVIAADISRESLKKAEELAKRMGIESQLECRLGDGLSVLKPGEAQGIIIAGMGGPLLMRILEQGWKAARSAQYLVLSPHNYPDSVRQYLNLAGFCIEKEEISQEKGKFYPIMKARLGREAAYSPLEVLVGRNVLKNQEWREYVRHEAEVQRHILAQAGDSPAGQKAQEKIALYEQALLAPGKEK